MEDEVSLTNEELVSIPTDDITKMYLAEIKKYPLLKKDELMILLEEYRKGSKKAKEKIVNSNLRLVVSIAYRYKDKTASFSLLDLIQEGNIGLMRALETYDINKGSFSNYATIWIKQSIIRAIGDKDKTIREPIHFINLANQYKKFLELYYKEHKKCPDDNYIKQELGITDEMLDILKNKHIYNVKSLNEKIDKDDSDSDEFGRFVGEQESGYDEVVDTMDKIDYLNVIKSMLKPIEYYILCLRVLNDSKVTLEDIARQFGITKERVRQYEQRALEKIKLFVRKDSNLYEGRLSRVKKIHGNMYKNLKTEPLSPEQICIFLYVKDKLSFLGQKILYLKLIDQYNYDKEEIIRELGITEYEYNIINDNLNEIMKQELSDVNKFKSFKNRILKEKGTEIYNINLIEKEDVIDYEKINNKYLNLSLEELESFFEHEIGLLNKSEIDIIYKYFGNKERVPVEEINKKLTLLMFGFRNNKQNNKSMYDTFIKNKDQFTDAQILFLECYVFNIKPKRYYDKLYPNHASGCYGTRAIEKLEMIHYGIYCMSGHKLDIDKYLIVRKDYADELGQEKIELLDLYYGVNQKKKGIKELADIYDVPYEQMHKLLQGAKYSMISIYNNRDKYSKIDKSVYHDYILNPGFRLTNEARKVLKLFIIDKKTYDEISKITGITKAQILVIISNSISKIDNYRFNINHFHNLDLSKIQKVYSYCKNSFTTLEKKVIKDNYISGKNREDIAKENNLPINEVNNIIRNFSNLYFSYQIRDVEITYEDVFKELNVTPIESILNEIQREVLSDYYGIRSKYNTYGLSLTDEEIMSKLNITKSKYNSVLRSAINKVKGRKIGIIKPDSLFIEKNDLIKLLKDPHLPILQNEREIICSLYGINGYIEKSLDELSKEYNITLESMRRKYTSICVNILKYKNNEIEGSINYEYDILPNLQYFPNCYRILIEEKYSNNLTDDDIAKKYQLTKCMITKMFDKITEDTYEIIENPKSNRFDFEFYEKNKNNVKLPFYGNKELNDKIFRMYYGMDDIKRKTAKEIIKELNLSQGVTTLYEVINSYMLAFCKLKDGITKEQEFTYDEIKQYYIKNESNMEDCTKNEYLKYFSKHNNGSLNYGRKINISNNILYDMIIDKTGSFFDIENCSREEIIQILKEYNDEINLRIKNSIMTRFDIKGKEFMTGKEMNHLYKILDKLDKAVLIQKPSSYIKKIKL